MTTTTPKKAPKPKKGTAIPADWQERFLLSLAEYGNVSTAAKAAKVSRQHVYLQRDLDEAFKQAWDIALNVGTGALEDEARRRAFKGVRKPVYQKGMLVGHVQEYSDTLLIFLLKAHKPELYRDRQEITGANGGPLEMNLTDDERVREITAILETARARAAGSSASDEESGSISE